MEKVHIFWFRYFGLLYLINQTQLTSKICISRRQLKMWSVSHLLLLLLESVPLTLGINISSSFMASAATFTSSSSSSFWKIQSNNNLTFSRSVYFSHKMNFWHYTTKGTHNLGLCLILCNLIKPKKNQCVKTLFYINCHHYISNRYHLQTMCKNHIPLVLDHLVYTVQETALSTCPFLSSASPKSQSLKTDSC